MFFAFKYHWKEHIKAIKIPCDFIQSLIAVMVSFVATVYMLTCLCLTETSKDQGRHLHNVAYSKTVTLTSQFSSSRYEGWRAVNGIFSDFAHTGNERFPWLRIDLDGSFIIHEIEVFARSDCCSKFMCTLHSIYLPFYLWISIIM